MPHAVPLCRSRWHSPTSGSRLRVSLAGYALFDGVVESLRRLRQANYLLIVVTNQSGVARGYYTSDDVHRLHQSMQGFCGGRCPIDGFAAFDPPNEPAFERTENRAWGCFGRRAPSFRSMLPTPSWWGQGFGYRISRESGPRADFNPHGRRRCHARGGCALQALFERPYGGFVCNSDGDDPRKRRKMRLSLRLAFELTRS